MIHEVTAGIIRQNPIDKNAVYLIMIQIQIHIAALRLVDYHFFRCTDKAHAGYIGIFQEFLQRYKTPVHLLNYIHGFAVRQRHFVFRLGNRCHHTHHRLADRIELFHIPGKQFRQLKERKRFTGRCAVNYDQIIFSAVVNVPYFQQ